jgi:uncharacterized membrane protein YhaH (DUF805 family)
MKYYLKVLQNYATFSGRARRSEFWYFLLFNLIIAFALGFVSQQLVNLYAIAILVPSIAVGVRRMHDVGLNGWIILIPIYNLVIASHDGIKGNNEYGADSKANA